VRNYLNMDGVFMVWRVDDMMLDTSLADVVLLPSVAQFVGQIP
jgi:hypothetical protein